MPDENIIECADCGAILESNVQHGKNDEDDPVCEDCANEYTTCEDCSEIVRRDSEHRDESNNPICESCGEHYNICNDCDAVIHEDNGTWIANAEVIVCSRCLDNHYYRCEDCGRYVSEDDSYGLGSGGHVCQTCYERNDYGRCCDCGDIYHTSALNYEDDEDYCDDCFRIRQSDSNLAIHQYAYKPYWIYYNTSFERARNKNEPFYLGVELEVENTSGGAYTNSDTALAMKELAPLVCKQDGSIHDGFELVFHPQTYAYAATDGRKGIEGCLRELRQRRFSGHNYGGMHVHVSLSSFSRLHLYKFHQLFKNARSLFVAISQRKPEKLEQWASFAGMSGWPNGNVDRYCALNYTRHTVEVRIFNSTLRADRFYKNLETVKAAIDYAKQCSLRDLDAPHFLEFIMQNRGIYRNLATFLVEKCVNALTDVVVDVRVVRQVQKRIMRRAG